MNLPTVEKEQIRDSLDHFTRTDVPSEAREYLTTGGSSAVPFGFYLLRRSSREERAFVHNIWRPLGWRPGDATAVFRGAFVPEEGRLWGFDRYSAELRLSGYHYTAEHVPHMLQEVERRGIKYIQAYPSAGVLLARLVSEGVAKAPPRLQGCFLGSETLLPWQRDLVQRVFSCQSVAWYGHAEAAALAYECAAGCGYHVDERYGIIELLDARGQPLTRQGESGEMVATTLREQATLFIRYRTGDMATWGSAEPCSCGRPGRKLLMIHGRVQEFVVSRRGRPVSATAINMHNDLFDHVLRFQFRQHEPGSVDLLLLPGPGFGEADRDRIQQEIGTKLGEDFDLNILVVSEIQLSPRLKQRFIDQRLPVDQFAVPQIGQGR